MLPSGEQGLGAPATAGMEEEKPILDNLEVHSPTLELSKKNHLMPE